MKIGVNMKTLIIALTLILLVTPSFAESFIYNPKDTSQIEADIADSAASIAGNTSSIQANNTDIDRNENNIFINAFRIAANHSLTGEDMDDGWVDYFADQSGVDLAAGSNYTYDASGDYYSYSDTAPTPVVPIVHLKMNDDAANKIITDSMGNLTMTSTVDTSTMSYSSGKIGKAMTFTTGEYLVGGYIEAMDSSEGSFSFWVRPSTTDRDYHLMGCGTLPLSSGKTFGVRVGPENGRMYYGASNGTTPGGWVIPNQMSVPYTNWSHHVVTWDGATVKEYENGVLYTGTYAGTGFNGWASVYTWDKFFVGVRGNSGFGYDGEADDIRIYDSAISASLVTAIYNGGSGTEDEDPLGISGGPMELICTNGVAVADSAPAEARMMLIQEDTSGTAVPNTNILGWASSDDGVTWDAVTLENIGELSAGLNILSGLSTLTGASTNIKWRVTTYSVTNQGRIYGASIMWK